MFTGCLFCDYIFIPLVQSSSSSWIQRKKFVFYESGFLQDHLSFTANGKRFFLGANLQITPEISVRSVMWTTSVLRDEWYSWQSPTYQTQSLHEAQSTQYSNPD